MVVGKGFLEEAESLLGEKQVSEIKNVKLYAQKQIEYKNEEFRQLIGNRYNDLIDIADSILLMKSSCELISSHILSISDSILTLSSSDRPKLLPNPNPDREKNYGIATRVKYFSDTPEKIWSFLDEFMFLEASARHIRANLVYRVLLNLEGQDGGMTLKKKFPLLDQQWKIVKSFKGQISQRSRDRLWVKMGKEESDLWKLPIRAFADALAGVAIVDELDPRKTLELFLDSRKSWILRKLSNFDGKAVLPVLREVTKMIQVTIVHVGELFLQVSNDMPLFYKVILGSPPAAQLFGGIVNPDEEVSLWNVYRKRLESIMVMLDRGFIANACSSWLRQCRREIAKTIDGRRLIDAIPNGAELALVESLIRETIDSKDMFDQGSLEWLESVCGSKIEFPWSRTKEFVLEESCIDIWEEIFEDVFVSRMKVIIDSGFKHMTKAVNVSESISTLSFVPGMKVALNEEFGFGGCLSAYLGPEASQIRDEVDSCCHSVLEDLLCFLESPKAASRLKDLAPYLQYKCYASILTILSDMTNELNKLHAALDSVNKGTKFPPPAEIIEKSLFIGRLLFAFRYDSKHIQLVLGSPRVWMNQTGASGLETLPSLSRNCWHNLISLTPDSSKPLLNDSRRERSLAAIALIGANDSTSPKVEELTSNMRYLTNATHDLWILLVSDELASTLIEDLRADDAISVTNPLQGWEEIVVKQVQSRESGSEMKIMLPSMPSLCIISYLFKACEKVHYFGGHNLDKTILQQFAKRLLEKVIGIYSDFVTNGVQMSEKGILQVLLDLRFVADILSGSDSTVIEGISKHPLSARLTYRMKQDRTTTNSSTRERIDDLINCFSQRLDPIDRQMFEPYLWENGRQAYLRHAILFGFFVQLNRMYTDTAYKLPTDSESNFMRCSTDVPRFRYYEHAFSPKVASKASIQAPNDDAVSFGAPQKAYTNGEFFPSADLDDNSSSEVIAPFLKSFSSQTLNSITSTPMFLGGSAVNGILTSLRSIRISLEEAITETQY